MKIDVPLENGLLPDRYGKFAPATNQLAGQPVTSFPIKISNAPTTTKAYAIVMVDYDSIPVCGFTWIHWIATNIPGDLQEIP